MPTENSRPGNRQKTRERDQKKPKASVFQSLKRRDILILVVFWLTSACVVGLILIFFFIRSSEISNPVIELNEGEATAKKLYPVAEAAAQAWESDVQFVSASAGWEHASLAALEAPVEWVYRFYSPGLQRILFVIVTPGQEVIVRPHLQKVRRELKIVDIDQWAMDSPTALSNWLNNGGNGWLQGALNPTVSAQLTYNPIREELEWTVSGLDLETGQQSNYTARAE
jgi:hypothetical protein